MLSKQTSVVLPTEVLAGHNLECFVKICSRCKKEKSLSEFYNNKKSKDGKGCWCIKCDKENSRQNKKQKAAKDRERYLRNQDRYKENSREWRLKNPHYGTKYQQANPEKTKKKHKTFAERHPRANAEKTKKWKEKHPTYEKDRYHSDPSFRFLCILRRRHANVLKGVSKSASTIEMLGCSLEEALCFLESQFPVDSGWSFEGPGRKLWHIDHKRPLISFDLTDHEQQKIAFHFTNLQPLSVKDNLNKGAKYNPQDYETSWIKADEYRWRLCDNKRMKADNP